MIPLNLLKSIISSIERRTLRHILGKQRLRLSNDEITLYVYSLFLQQSKSIHFKVIYKRLRKRKKLMIKYGTYMHHVQQCAKLFLITG